MSQRECTVYRHAWFPVPGDWDPPFNGETVTLRCERCGSERREVWQPNTGALLYRRYVRTAGWISYKRDERPTQDQFRLALIEQAITETRKARPAKKAASNRPGTGLRSVGEVSNRGTRK